MKTSDAAISACVELAYHAFVQFRTFGSMEVGTRQMEEKEVFRKREDSLKVKEYVGRQAAQHQTMMRCLIADIGDEATNETLSGMKDLADKWRFELVRQQGNNRAFVSDDIKLKIFQFIDATLESVVKYCSSVSNEGAEKLYWEMDRAHNVPHEIYKANRDKLTKYGNFFNK